MARTTVTEESLGLSPTEDELNTTVTVPDDDIATSEDSEPALAPAKPSPEARPAKADEPPAETQKEGEQPPAADPKMVDVRAVQEARAEARAAKQQAALLEQRWNDFLAYQQAPKQAEPEAPAPIPDVDDPQAVLAWARAELLAQKEREAKHAQQTQQQTAEEQQYQQAFAKVDADFRATAAVDPTVNEALNALRESQGNELLAMGYSIPEAKAILAKNERDHVVFVAARGIPIADHIKSLAAARGWRPQAQQQAAAPATQKTDLAAVAAAQQRHQSLSDAPGGESVAPLDAKALARMSDKEFKVWMSKKGNEAKFDEIMGR